MRIVGTSVGAVRFVIEGGGERGARAERRWRELPSRVA